MSVKHLLLLGVLFTAGSVQAADRLPITQVRFSPDGTRVMVLSAGALDGSGFITARLNVLSTTTGQSVYARSLTDQTQPAPSPSQVSAQLLGNITVQRTLIAQGLQPGVSSQPRFNRVYAAPYPQWSDAVPAGKNQMVSVPLWGKGLPVRLDVYAVTNRCKFPQLLGPGGVNAGFRLTVNKQVVYQEAKSSTSDRCAARFVLERVDVKGNRALLVVRAYRPGFEGPDADPVLIATTLR